MRLKKKIEGKRGQDRREKKEKEGRDQMSDMSK
jgi:hypothetical protein